MAKSLPIGVGDEQRLTQVLLNLVGNAIKFTDAGEVRVTAAAENGQFTLSVSDTGIPAGEHERIFEKFRQVDSSNTRAKGGTGVGLAIAREIVEMHGGRIWVESAPAGFDVPHGATGARSAGRRCRISVPYFAITVIEAVRWCSERRQGDLATSALVGKYPSTRRAIQEWLWPPPLARPSPAPSYAIEP